jgi:prefoldin subunit 5
MTDPRDLESSLTEMDRKLRELQREVELLSRPPEQEHPREPERPPSPPPPLPSASSAEAIEHAAARVAELGRRIEALTDLRNELDRATEALREEHRRATSVEPSE